MNKVCIVLRHYGNFKRVNNLEEHVETVCFNKKMAFKIVKKLYRQELKREKKRTLIEKQINYTIFNYQVKEYTFRKNIKENVVYSVHLSYIDSKRIENHNCISSVMAVCITREDAIKKAEKIFSKYTYKQKLKNMAYTGVIVTQHNIINDLKGDRSYYWTWYKEKQNCEIKHDSRTTFELDMMNC
jgi:uncharacterized protein YifE (UPF0438 family)